ncbi:hypothetical protein LKI_01975 [Leuconostoc kimchii IMSNU 11154]|uniref:Uncharacterized protein n=1 Tax=Leuconostoc kimchii (strain IMSNU 11154 / KCTC 2386 / IH25) TaxID=762051 RepID=D5T0Y9_LEUKI|nr:hypothetical protein [Leuconostoc kimchii]ADG39938.1 hypothetical protein LKI_01975 [Leuconostoc kimchii IMSNU 11154]
MNEFENVHLEHEYSLESGTLHVDTPGSKHFKDIFIEETPSLLRKISLYDNGLIIYFEQTSSKIVLRTNRPLYQIGDGKFSIEDPEK